MKDDDPMKERELVHAIEEYDGLIRRVMKRCRVEKMMNDREDLYQELKLLLLKLMLPSVDLTQFQQEYPEGYLYNRLVWRCTDLQRKIWKNTCRESLFEDPTTCFQESETTTDFEADVMLADRFTGACQSLGETEKGFLRLLIRDGQVPCLDRHKRCYYRKRLRPYFGDQ